MRRIQMFNRVSADGYFGAPDGNIEWPAQDPELDKSAVSGMADHDAMMFGRTTYEGFMSFWPHAVDQAPHGPARRSPELAAMAAWINEVPKYVFSRTLTDASWSGTRLLGAFDPKVVEELKRGPGKNIMIFGSGSIVSLLTEHGLIDEYTFVVSPLLLGSGLLPIRGVTKHVPLKLIECKEFAAGNVRLRYAKA
jgi:dihydrofolate reductase